MKFPPAAQPRRSPLPSGRRAGEAGEPPPAPAPPAGSPPPPVPKTARPRRKGRVPPAPCAGPRGRSGLGGRRSDPAALPGAAREAAASLLCRCSRCSRSGPAAAAAPGGPRSVVAQPPPLPAQRSATLGAALQPPAKRSRAGARPASRRAPCRPAAALPQRGLLRGAGGSAPAASVLPHLRDCE